MKARIRKTGESLAFTPEEMDELIANAKQNPTIDWEQRRYELAKAAMQGILSDKGSQEIAMNPHRDEYREYSIGIAQYAVACANALIEELKKNN